MCSSSGTGTGSDMSSDLTGTEHAASPGVEGDIRRTLVCASGRNDWYRLGSSVGSLRRGGRGFLGRTIRNRNKIDDVDDVDFCSPCAVCTRYYSTYVPLFLSRKVFLDARTMSHAPLVRCGRARKRAAEEKVNRVLGCVCCVWESGGVLRKCWRGAIDVSVGHR